MGETWTISDGSRGCRVRGSLFMSGTTIVSYLYLYRKGSMDRVSVDRTWESIPSQSAKGSMPIVVIAFRQYLTIDEELQICQQFHDIWRQNNQVMWSGMLREYAQAWADQHDMAT